MEPPSDSSGVLVIKKPGVQSSELVANLPPRDRCRRFHYWQHGTGVRGDFIVMPSVILARLVGYFVDGSFPEFVPTVIPSVVVLVLMLIAYKLMTGSTDQTTSAR